MVMGADGFDAFFAETETPLRRALVATYGPTVGRGAAVDALSWAWEHWDRLRHMDNPIGYLYRVGQTAASRAMRPLRVAPADDSAAVESTIGERSDLERALAGLSDQQRAVVVMVHGYGISQRETADILGISVSTCREHLARGMDRLRQHTEVHDAH
ncbi:MAG: sigma-70 family RNA polymerase sigma factor [Actinobacteria bacterium]|nr:sigma-70 family RNA polymerase sigma factor [Actinomycetota bacterium]